MMCALEIWQSVTIESNFFYSRVSVCVQVEMTGSSVFDYIHHADHVEIAEQLGLSLSNQGSMPSPSSGHSSDETHGTNNPDGELLKKKLFLTSHTLFFVLCCVLSDCFTQHIDELD